ncbi:O-antigen ligase family protein [Kiritimatiellota bacterium B12222]|nr:O-antigen ligase family protein [Kiritimatiellota bacterium B12222]
MVTLFGGTRMWAAGPFLIPLLLLGSGFLFFTFWQSNHTHKTLALPRDFFFWILLLLYVGIRAAFFSSVPYETWTEMGFLFIAWILYGLFSDLGNQSGTWTLVAFFLLATVLAHALWALSLHWHESAMVLWLPRPAQYGMRASGTFICPNHFAHFIQMGTVLALGILFTPKARLSLRLFAAYVLIPCLIIQVLTHSRSGLIGTFVGLSVILFGKALRKGWKRTVGSLLVIGLSAFICIYALIQFYPPMRARMVRDVDTNIRITQIWPDTWSMIQAEGFWGTAPGVYIHTFPQYREHFNSSRLYLEYAHNEFLNTLAEYGWLASFFILGLCCWMVGIWIKAIVKTKSDQSAMIPIMMLALMASTMAHAIFDFNLHIPANGFLFVSLLGLLYGVGLQQGVWSPVKTTSWNTTRLYSLTGSVACLILIPFVVKMMMASWAEHQMKMATDLEQKAKYAEEILTWDSWNSLGWTLQGDDYNQQAFFMHDPEQKQDLIKQSRKAYEQAIARNPYDKSARAGLVKLARSEQNNELALELIENLSTISPFDVSILIQQGLILRELGRNQEALEVFEKVEKMQGNASRQVTLNIRSLRRILADDKK